MFLANFNCKPEEAVMIGDTAYDYLAARNANVKCILFKGSKRTYSEEVNPEAIVKTYSEIYQILKNHIHFFLLFFWTKFTEVL